MVLEHIQKLLFEHDCVIMPDFGGLITHYEPAKINPVRHTFSPPAKRVAFNEKLKINDGLLISTLAYDHKLSAGEAQRQVTLFVKELQRELNNNKRFDLKGIGIFRLNEESKTVFEYIENENLLNDSFGLPELLAKPIVASEPFILRTLLKEQQKPAKKGFRNTIRRYYRAATALVIGGVVVTGLYLLSLQTDYNVSAINPITLFQSDSAHDVSNLEPPTDELVALRESVTVEVQSVDDFAAAENNNELVPDSSILVTSAADLNNNSVPEEADKVSSPLKHTTAPKKESSIQKVYTPADPKKLVIAPGEAVLISAKANPPAPKEELRRNFTVDEINAALSTGNSKVNPESTGTAKITVAPNTNIIKETPAPARETPAPNKVAHKPVPTPEKPGSSAATAIKPKAERFYVIVNGYSTYEGAERNRKILAKKGRPGQIIAPFGGAKLYRIAIAEYDSRELAMQNLPELKNKYGNTIWILKR